VQSQEALTGYYQGNSSFYRGEVLRAWLPPVLTWGAFLLVLVGTMLCLSSLVRRRWVDIQINVHLIDLASDQFDRAGGAAPRRTR